MNKRFLGAVLATAFVLAGCAGAPTRPAAWSPPEVLVAPSSFSGVHGLAIDARGRLLAASVVGNAIWEVDRQSGAAKVFIPAPVGQADDIAIGPRGELAWTSYLQGIVRYRENDTAPIRELAKGLPGINSLDFDRRNGKLYASQVFLGDALWEIDVAGRNPPRLIKKDMGGFNGFEVGPDGWLYGPLWFKGQVAKINPADGALTVINSEFKIPAAANLDGKGNLWVVDTKAGELSRVELATGRKTVAKKLKSSIDNLAIAPDGTIYVANMADNSVEAYNPSTGDLRLLTGGKLAVPAGLRIAGDKLYVADIFAFREVDIRSGAVRDLSRMQDGDMEYPFGVGVSDTRYALTSWFTGTVHLMERPSVKTIVVAHGFKAPTDAIPLADGSVLVAELGSGNIVQASGPKLEERKTIASGLNGPVQMTLAQDGALIVTEAAGKLTRVNLANGDKSDLAAGLALPKGVAQTPWGSFIVLEVGKQRLVEIEPGVTMRVVAENLPVGLQPGPGLPPVNITTGVAVDARGNIYFSADLNNAIYRVRPGR